MTNFPFLIRFDQRGSTARPTSDAHLRQMVELLLLTNPGERVNRPDFGGGLLHMVFDPNSPEVAAALQFTIQASLQRWLGDLIDVDEFAVAADEGKLSVDLSYRVLASGERRTERFERSTT